MSNDAKIPDRMSILGMSMNAKDEAKADDLAYRLRVKREAEVTLVNHQETVWLLRKEFRDKKIQARRDRAYTFYKWLNKLSSEAESQFVMFLLCGPLIGILFWLLFSTVLHEIILYPDPPFEGHYYIEKVEGGGKKWSVYRKKGNQIFGTKVAAGLSEQEAISAFHEFEATAESNMVRYYVDTDNVRCYQVKVSVWGGDKDASTCYIQYSDAEARMWELREARDPTMPQPVPTTHPDPYVELYLLP